MSYGHGVPDPMDPFQPGQANPLALSTVKGPATGLLVTAGLSIPFHIVGLVYTLVFGPAEPQLPPNADPAQVQMAQNIAEFMGPVQMISSVLATIIGVVIIVGALKMMKLESYGLAMTSAVLIMLPCISPCCLLGLPIGMWAIVALNNSNVKTSFH
jgi:hypothetical protein